MTLYTFWHSIRNTRHDHLMQSMLPLGDWGYPKLWILTRAWTRKMSLSWVSIHPWQSPGLPGLVGGRGRRDIMLISRLNTRMMDKAALTYKPGLFSRIKWSHLRICEVSDRPTIRSKQVDDISVKLHSIDPIVPFEPHPFPLTNGI